ncbi:hypothetical protein D9613_001208 [Agrocybe pediades]|uniref:Cytochrome P450 n=1 Tax=Agrocybe pediades TaxID=84607 RepID=A0A8H4QZ81_9AGAR|nr:hypothetical protein D9613_001208 [Agrocybe pediades]
MHALATILVALLGVWALRKLAAFLRRRSSAPYPPGPIPKPLIGNVLDFPLVNAPEKYLEWGQKYNSDLLHAEVFGKHIIVINSLKIADELLERRAKIYSDRPKIPLFELFGWQGNVASMQYKEEWKYCRRICQQNFRPDAATKYWPLQVQKVRAMLGGLLNSPEDFDAHNKKLNISIPMASMYGYEVDSLEDPCVLAADESLLLGGSLLLPGGNFLDIIPALKYVPPWVPGAKSVQIAAKVRELTEAVQTIPLEFAKNSVLNGTASPSLVSDMFEEKFRTGISKEKEKAVENIAYTVYGAAADTTISLTTSFFYYMVKFPEVQKKAQAEIDRLLGMKRLPEPEDRPHLPYLEALYRELMRVAAPLPFVLPRATTEDDYYDGYYIPKGSTVLPNVWAMLHDEERYPDAFALKPERFLDESGQLNDDDRILAYGFGRRICVGRHIGSSTIWLMMASVLSCFDIGYAKDENGNDIEIKDDYEEFGVFRHKAKFQCSFTIRSEDARRLVMNPN